MLQWRVAATSPEILNGPPSLGAQKTPTVQIDALTGLRGFAALLVLFVHGSGLTAYPWFGLHGYGPIALFVLSGFLLFQPWSRWLMAQGEPPSLRSFFRRRFWRIFPPYLAMLGLTALLLPTSRPVGLDGWVQAVTLTHTLRPDGLRPSMEHTWSLSTELAWYVSLPIIGLILGWLVRNRRVRPMKAMLGIFLVCLVISASWRWLISYRVDDLAKLLTFPSWLPGFIACFMGGALIGHLTIAERTRVVESHWLRSFASRTWLVAAVAIGAALVANSPLGGSWEYEPQTFWERTIRASFCFIVALALLAGVAGAPASSWVLKCFSVKWLVAIGRWSYGIYLWHLPLRELLSREVPIQPGFLGLAAWLALLLGASAALGAATHAFIETPAVAFSKRSAPTRVVARRAGMTTGG